MGKTLVSTYWYKGGTQKQERHYHSYKTGVKNRYFILLHKKG